jgi:multidrug efflux pump
MTSTSSDGSSVITLQFALSLNIDVAEQEVQQSINAAGTYLPADLPVPPIYSKTNPADAPILTLALTQDDAAVEGGGPGRHAAGAEDFATAGRGPGQHQRRPEAGGADSGQSHALASYGLNLEDLRTPSWPPTSTRPRATSTARTSPTRSAPTTSCFPAPTTPLIVAYRNGAPVKLTDVAT